LVSKRTLYLPMMIAAAVAIACVVALSAVSEKADAAFPGKNGRIAYNSNGVIYTINTDGTGKFRVTDNRMMEYDPSYSPDGKRLVFSADLKKPFPRGRTRSSSTRSASMGKIGSD
jgi:Tol biopolymer transport system component